MNKHIVIIGSGFAAYQLVKSLRKQNELTPITVITADNGDDYSKPDLSHVFSQQQTANDLIKQTADDFARANNITLMPNTRVKAIDSTKQVVHFNDHCIGYSDLVLATGATSFIPPFSGNGTDEIVTLNSLMEYEEQQDKLATAKSVLVLGAGLIGTEIAMDLATSGKKVTLLDRATSLMPTLLPSFISANLYQTMQEKGVDIKLGKEVKTITRHHQELIVTLQDDSYQHADVIIAAMGLAPNTQLAQESGIDVAKGILVNQHMQTSVNNVYALGDCAELNGKVRAFLQPTMLSAMALAKTLLGSPTPVQLPASLVKVKTPWLPLHLSGDTTSDNLMWEVKQEPEGLVAKAFNQTTGDLAGFIVSHNQLKAAFPLLRLLPIE
ncbi:NADH:flavorubredoxin reductase NorW [Photobacterium frigidiphilum]|uniref:NADH:flavorubredoxin reductase NorW n=1 Tax=Photobacterium frigidiphilum TaxID=264736 RepID=A0A2T3JQW6_9GAMM|nr:NADH:flavorubredoxin reductase NorW [Photobacterium frigidiphilum]PSU51483.1 NADH:flavorubredoxin reductase NorW [Photobacterium frigidiphilum]